MRRKPTISPRREARGTTCMKWQDVRNSMTTEWSQYLSLNKWPSPETHCLFRVMWYERWRDADVWLWPSASEGSDAGLQPCLAKHVTCYLLTSAVVIDVMNRMPPIMHSPTFPGFSMLRRCWRWAHTNASLKPITTIPYWKLRRDTWVIKSRRRWFIRGTTVAWP